MACLWACSPGRPSTWTPNPPCPALGAPRGREHVADLIYGQLHLLPGVIDVGLLTQGMTYQCVLWNASPVPSARIHTPPAQLRGDRAIPRAPSGRARRLGGSGLLRDRLHAGHARRGPGVSVSSPWIRFPFPSPLRVPAGSAPGLAPERGLSETWEWLTHIAIGLWPQRRRRRPLRDVPRVSYGAA